jgi:hypothetical protein
VFLVRCELRLKKKLLTLRQIVLTVGREMRLKKKLLFETYCVTRGVRAEAEEKAFI